MSSVVGLLNENIMEGLKSFYKLRKAFVTLDAILDAERKYMVALSEKSAHITKSNSVMSLNSTLSKSSANGMPGGFRENMSRSKEISRTIPRSVPQIAGGDDAAKEEHEGSDAGTDSSENFTDAEELKSSSSDVNGITKSLAGSTLSSPKTPFTPLTPRTPTKLTLHLLEHDPDDEVFANPIDAFVHSGANLCFGMLLLMLSMIPPAFGKLLFIVGFRGDRQRGIRMLWQSSKFHNINGAMAGLIVLGYYNGLVGFCDILPDQAPASSGDSAASENLEGYPARKLESLLADMRVRYPKSHLWLLEEARMEASHKNLSGAIELLSGSSKSPLKQVEALSMFEKSLNAMYSHRYELTTESFIECVRLNNWSHALYYYIAASAQVELYRRAKDNKDATSAEKYAARAVELYGNVREHAGKKKFMARQLPFDVFVVRKLNKWEARAKEWSVPMIDAIGISPLEEMIYFWNGNRRQPAADHQTSLEALAWSEDLSKNPTWSKESLDEHAILAVLRSAIYRNQGNYTKAKDLLKAEVFSHDRALFKGHLRDDWTCPTAHYEMGANLWAERDGSEGDIEKVREAEEWVEKAGKWESYELDARIGLKVTTGLETLRGWRALNDV
jgi:hypothetical protein